MNTRDTNQSLIQSLLSMFQLSRECIRKLKTIQRMIQQRIYDERTSPFGRKPCQAHKESGRLNQKGSRSRYHKTTELKMD